MNRAIILALILTSGGAVFSSHASTTTQLTGIGRTATEDTLVQKTRVGRCRAWRRECVIRWGVGGPAFRRCLARRGCL
jgi:hypothetical protein